MHMDMTEELGIPRLDPLSIDELDLSPILNEFVNLSLTIKNFLIKIISEKVWIYI